VYKREFPVDTLEVRELLVRVIKPSIHRAAPASIVNRALAVASAIGILATAGCSTQGSSGGSQSKNQAAAPADNKAAMALLDHLTGNWVLTCTLAGKETTHDVDVEWILNHEYLRLHEVSRGRKKDGAADYEAIVFIGWDERRGDISCLWLDSTAGGGLSAAGIAHGRPSGSSIPFIFDLTKDTVFLNTFFYDAGNDTWKWNLDSDEAGKREVFGRVTLAHPGAPAR
jgi:hypothetical protein